MSSHATSAVRPLALPRVAAWSPSARVRELLREGLEGRGPFLVRSYASGRALVDSGADLFVIGVPRCDLSEVQGVLDELTQRRAAVVLVCDAAQDPRVQRQIAALDVLACVAPGEPLVDEVARSCARLGRGDPGGVAARAQPTGSQAPPATVSTQAVTPLAVGGAPPREPSNGALSRAPTVAVTPLRRSSVALAAVGAPRAHPSVTGTDHPPESGSPRRYFGRPELCLIGVSTGGPEALEWIVRGFNAGSPPLVIVQHMPARFTAELAARLDTLTAARVVEARDGQALQPGHVYIAPGGTRHLELSPGSSGPTLRLCDGDPLNGHRPSVDALLRSALSLKTSRICAAIMTGLGDDGVAGLGELRAAGCRTLAQAPEDCTVYGMPRQAFERGSAEYQVALRELARALHGD